MELPSDFTSYTRHLFGDELYDKFVKALDEESPVSIRLNQFKVQNSKFTAHSSQLTAQIVPWCSQGYYLNGRPAFTFDPLLHAGLYYVQEASSMFVCEIVRQLIHEPVMMLDLCAAPGGKTTALRSALPSGSLLFANEPIKTRASILKENIIKFGHPDVIVTNNYPQDYRKGKLQFDAILADVPCSGEGMFRKDANAVGEWSLQNVENCRGLQRSIMKDMWPCLRPGGVLIYSTCTFNAQEDEENVEWIAETLGADFVKLQTNVEWGIHGSLAGNNPVCRFIPGETRGEGLFIAALRKHGDSRDAFCLGNVKVAGGNRQSSMFKSQRSWINGDFSFDMEKEFVRAVPSRWNGLYNDVKRKLHVIHAGVGMGTIKGKDIVPDVSLALSIALSEEAFPIVELGYNDAIRYLRKEAMVLAPSVPKGFVVVAYEGHPLGFVKNLGNRANNLYPQEWRIRSSYTPTHASSRS